MVAPAAMLIAQISDTHIRAEGKLAYRRVDTAQALARCVEHLRRLTPRPEVVLATGDLTDGARPEEYRRLRALLAPLPMPVYVIPGNHDDRENFAAAFADHTYLPRSGRFLHYVVEGYPVRLIGLDTLVPGQGGGLMCEERLAWLDARLAEARGRPTVIFMHHPPFPTGIRHMDAQGLANAEAMGAVVRRHPQVEAILCGHLHRPIHVRWHGTVATTAPSPAHQVVLDLTADGPSAFVIEPRACLLHLWREGVGLVTHTSYIGDFDGPYPFYDGGHLIE
jgi:3',5'-cyclic AMP phosphodiesterase CpdA